MPSERKTQPTGWRSTGSPQVGTPELTKRYAFVPSVQDVTHRLDRKTLS